LGAIFLSNETHIIGLSIGGFLDGRTRLSDGHPYYISGRSLDLNRDRATRAFEHEYPGQAYRALPLMNPTTCDTGTIARSGYSVPWRRQSIGGSEQLPIMGQEGDGLSAPSLLSYRATRCAPTRRQHERSLQKGRGAIGATDPALADLIVTRIVELAKDGVYDIEELSSRTLSTLKLVG
jgi:hypothetical protein